MRKFQDSSAEVPKALNKPLLAVIFRFLFFNRHVGVLYSCLSISDDGRCDERAIYVISRHETIDHAELIVLEKVAKAVCVDPQVLYHTATFDDCVYDHAQLRPPLCSTIEAGSSVAEWERLNEQQIQYTYGTLTYHAVASSDLLANPFALRFDGKDFLKISEGAGRSTETLMLSALEDWTKALDQGGNIDVIYFDFAKAFDRVPFNELISKLVNIGLHPRIVNWIKNFITGRSFQVRVNESFSHSHPVTSGVPQGGVLSPILFIIYTSQIPGLVSRYGVSCKMFADDIKIYKNISSNDDRVALQSAISAILEWSVEWKLPLSSPKTKLFHLGRSREENAYFLGDVQLSSTNTICDLGFTLNTNLTFDDHCRIIARRADHVVHNIFRSLSTKSPAHLLVAYKSYVRPILEYGATVFSPKSKRSISRLEAVQNSFTRKLWIRLHGYDYANTPPAFIRNCTFSIPTLDMRIRKYDLVMAYKIISGKVNLPTNKFYTVSPSCTRGGPFKITFQTAKTSLRSSFFTQRAGSVFLRLSKKYILPHSLAQYKRLVDKFLKESA
ncbi:hypothetical protein Y032_0235g3198 [Ancylostoma ceylanicum]|uniref:Reverse transcriptase domain-containing protein n=1 Tax=Ancylostoma ceylanicum TaxID=53326 RepID=A0A016SF21_9BILA|nr:hypothetical protein Y032_0235g3198 [Ancylostoma ceylanicum]